MRGSSVKPMTRGNRRGARSTYHDGITKTNLQKQTILGICDINKTDKVCHLWFNLIEHIN